MITQPPPFLETHSLTMHFGPVRALNGVDLFLQRGEVHGIIGENGAGKSTLMRILAGLQIPTSGEVRIDGEAVAIQSAAEATRRGIVMIHQELNLVEELTVAENIFLGRETTRLGLINRTTSRERAGQLLKDVGCDVSPDDRVGSLSIAQQQMVEIAKALSTDARLLIMDEPTAVLTRSEVAKLFDLIARLKARGVTMIYISHILPEVLKVCDRITVLRDGAMVKTLANSPNEATAPLTEHHLASLMVGRPMADHFPKRVPHGNEIVLSVEGLTSLPWADHVSFEVRRGEILGFAGLIGAGRTETAEAVVGIRPRSRGTLLIDGVAVHIRNVQDAVRHGIAYLSEDRKAAGLTLPMSVVSNTTLVSLKRYSKLLIDQKAEEKATREHVARLRVRVGDMHQPVATLSGGNQQKVLLAKWLETKPKVLIIDEPTRGVDIGAKEEIYRLIHELTQQGMACVMISSELNELLGMCHRIAVMRQGRIVGVVSGSDMTEERVMQYAAVSA